MSPKFIPVVRIPSFLVGHFPFASVRIEFHKLYNVPGWTHRVAINGIASDWLGQGNPDQKAARFFYEKHAAKGFPTLNNKSIEPSRPYDGGSPTKGVERSDLLPTRESSPARSPVSSVEEPEADSSETPVRSRHWRLSKAAAKAAGA